MGALRPNFLLEEKNMKFTPRRIAFSGILAALYAAITIVEGLLAPELAYGTIQFRFAEALTVLCCFTPAAIPGMVVGCFVSNFFNPLGFSTVDAVFGTTATLLACLLTRLMSRKLEQKPWISCLVPLPTILFNAAIIGAELAIFVDEGAFLPAWGYNALTVGAGEAAVLYVLGLPLLFWLWKDKRMSAPLKSF